MELKEKIIKSLYNPSTIISLVIIMIIVFVLESVIRVFTEGAFGGTLNIGFPLVFYSKVRGVPNVTAEFNLLSLIVDVFLYYVIAIFISFKMKK